MKSKIEAILLIILGGIILVSLTQIVAMGLEIKDRKVINRNYYQLVENIKKEYKDLLINVENKQMVIDIKNRQIKNIQIENESLKYIINGDPKLKRLLKKG